MAVERIRAMVPGFVKRRAWGQRDLPSTPVYDLGPRELRRAGAKGGGRRVLLSYITRPFRISPTDRDNLRFSNIGIARSIVRALNELGYLVDVVEWEDKSFVPKRQYKLFVGHGGINYERIARDLAPETRKIYFSTGAYWRFHNEQELARIEGLKERRSVNFLPDRFIEHSEEWANENAAAIICLGNDFVRKTYRKFPVVRSLNNAAYAEPRFGLGKKDFDSARRNFLFFAGGGSVHKGLDLLLEAFARVDAELWICQFLQPQFARIYRHELKDLSNIHNVGWVPMRGKAFYALAEKCGYAILPSCSEGCAGSVVECLHHGLIPVVSRETTLETGDYGITLEDCSIETIARTVEELSQKPEGYCAQKSQATRGAAEQDFSESGFSQNIRQALASSLQS